MDMSVYVYVGVCLQQEKYKLQQKKNECALVLKITTAKERE